MAEINSISTPATSLNQAAFDLCIDLGTCFELIEQEIAKVNSTDVAGIEFLVDAAKTKLFRFGDLVYTVTSTEGRDCLESEGAHHG